MGLFSVFKKPSGNTEELISKLPSPFVFTPDPMPGRLAGVRHEYSGGSMNFGDDFDIDVTPSEIVYASFWDIDKSRDNKQVLKNVSLSPAQWGNVEKAVTDLWNSGKWKIIPDEVLNKKTSPSEEFMLDGGDYSRWFLTFETADGAVTRQYYDPSERRIVTLRNVLFELADPKGREIKWYEEPYVTGIYYWNSKESYSFQCTRKNAASDRNYDLFIHDERNKEKTYASKTVTKAFFEEIRPVFAWIDTSDRKGSRFDKKTGVTFYYSDGTQPSFEIEKKYADVIEEILRRYS
jgi:hypothetical protein